MLDKGHRPKALVRALLLLLSLAMLGMAADDGFGRADAARGWHPSGIAAAGDSLSTGYGSEGDGDHPRNSWSIGDNPVVASHYARIRRQWPRVSGHVLLVARDGARVDALAGQLQQVVSHRDIDYVTIQIGVNDICEARTEAGITPVPVFRDRFARALRVLYRDAPDARVLVTSLADEARWNDAVLQIPSAARQIEDGTVCDPRPQAGGRQDSGVRARIHRWEESYNRVLASVCRGFRHCRYDGGALYRLAYGPADVSTHDAFHPSVRGLARMAAVTWPQARDLIAHP